MARVAPWHAAGTVVYHDNTACSEGQAIGLKDLRAGAGGRSLCEVCARFDADESRRDFVDTTEVVDADGHSS